MAEIKKVVLAGATGTLGSKVLTALLDANFAVTVLSRSAQHNLPSSVTVTTVDYTSLSSLTTALQDHDAVVSTLGTAAVGTQKLLIDASIAAGIKRFIPSEFGCDLQNPKTRVLPVYKFKVDIEEYLFQLGAENKITYTLIFTGAFLDSGLEKGFVLDVAGRKATLYDGGDRPFSASRLSTIGSAVAAVLSHEKETSNASVRIHDLATTQNSILAIAQKYTSSDHWSVSTPDTAAMEKAAYEDLKAGSADPSFWVSFVKRAIWGEGFGGAFEEVWNEKLGLKGIEEKELDGLVKGLATGKGSSL